jgi:micrococcal nuclease
MLSSFIRYFTCRISPNTVINPQVVVKLPSNKSIDITIDDTMMDETDAWNWKTTKPFVPPVSNGKCIKCYDGDTITIATRLPFDQYMGKKLTNIVYRFPVRLNGIDCPEIKGKTPAEKALAIVARDELKKKILDKHIILKNVATEKYGRLLADVYVVENGQEIWINKWMLDMNYAVKYDGGTKQIPEEWRNE